MSRRRFLGSVGTATIAGFAGCGGDDDSDSGGEGTPEDPLTPTVVRGVERFDTTVVLAVPNTMAEFQYQRYGTLAQPELNRILSFDLAGRSFGDGAMYGELVEDWSYDTGTLEITLHDDFLYWDGEPVDADNVLLHYRLEEFVTGSAGDLAHPSIDDVERTGAYSVRFTLADDWREDYALERAIGGWGPRGSTSYYRPWLERFEDAGNEDELLDVVRDLVNTGESDPDPFFNSPFRIVDVHESSEITCELRSDESPVPHYVDDINVETLAITLVHPRRQAERIDLFRSQWRPNGRVDEIDLDSLGFEIDEADFPPSVTPWSILFNCSEPPTENVHFRRAIAFMTDREAFMRASDVIANERHTPFATRDREAASVSTDVLDSLEDFGWDGVLEESATREMERGGFERDSEGRWLYADGPDAGEPMELTVLASPAHSVVENRGEQFRQSLGDWGLALSFDVATEYGEVLERGSGYTLATADWGGGIPERAMELNFASDPAPVTGATRIPETVEAPPVGEPWPTVDDRRTYDVRSMTSQLQTVHDDAAYQRLVDELTWVYNQTTPRIGVETVAREHAFNASRYDVALPEDAPERWTQPPPYRLATTGVLEYVPPTER